ncbi:threonylcarbamoyl-AMP synthase [Candidatus Uhrbacteria bacterium]|jgi:L-threonylcarbamoyladenylate synthase|nr:threonylcarbamoyl-AMP synthase [Candidatus Uhrbacteria bacterium]MBT7716895.1 threonylcarbamoyl-AMP synthase [Candidatus Uhrbacteria bacterium]
MLSITSQDIERALACLQKGEVIIFPTETSYGIGCDATNADAVERVFLIKGRPDEKGAPVIIPDQESASEYIKINDKARVLMDRFWPGPLNIIGEVKSDSSVASKCAFNGTQAVRVSSHPFCAILARRFGKPIVASSANISGKDAAYSISEVKKAFADRSDGPDCIIDGGDLPQLPASTTVKIEGDRVEILRQGSVKIEL